MEVTFEATVRRYACADGKANVELVLIPEELTAPPILERLSAEGTATLFGFDGKSMANVPARVSLCSMRYSSKEGERAVKLAIKENCAPPAVREALDTGAYAGLVYQFRIEAIQKELPGIDDEKNPAKKTVKKMVGDLRRRGVSIDVLKTGDEAVDAALAKKTPKKKTARPRKVVKKKKGSGRRGPPRHGGMTRSKR